MLVDMKTLICILFRRMAAALRDRWYRQLEHLALLHQVEIFQPHYDSSWALSFPAV